MNLDEVMDEAAGVLQEISGLRCFAYPPPTVSGPAGYISYPLSIRFDETYGRGEDAYVDLSIVVLIGRPTDKTTRDKAAEYAAGTGARSVKARMEAHEWESCDDLHVGTAEFDVEEVGSVPYLALVFKATATGPGED